MKKIFYLIFFVSYFNLSNGYASDIFESFYIDKQNLDKVDENGQNILHRLVLAADYEKLADLFDLALTTSIDVNALDNYGMAPLHYAVKSGCFSCLYYLDGLRADLDLLSIAEETPLEISIQRNDVEFVEALLRKGANPSGYSKDGTPYLIKAVQANQVEVVKRLIFYGADVRAIDSNDKNAFYFSVLNGNYRLFDFLNSINSDLANTEEIKFLIEKHQLIFKEYQTFKKLINKFTAYETYRMRLSRNNLFWFLQNDDRKVFNLKINNRIHYFKFKQPVKIKLRNTTYRTQMTLIDTAGNWSCPSKTDRLASSV